MAVWMPSLFLPRAGGQSSCFHTLFFNIIGFCVPLSILSRRVFLHDFFFAFLWVIERTGEKNRGPDPCPRKRKFPLRFLCGEGMKRFFSVRPGRCF